MKGTQTRQASGQSPSGALVALWWAPLDLEPDDLDRLTSSLSAEEQGRARRYRRPVDADHYRAGRGWLRQLLGAELGCSAAEVEIASGEHGKPSAPGSDLRFNASHSGALFVIATSWEVEVGVDVEVIRPNAEVDRIAKRFFSVNERRALAALPDGPRLVGSFECWTRKEAYLKGVGVGLRVPLEDVDVWGGPSTTTVLDGWRIHSFVPQNGYAAAVAGQRTDDWAAPDPRPIGSPGVERSADSIGHRGPLGGWRFPPRENAN
ncbi:MAG: 4'-phosphopantetheinyl transferase family protein [Acidimicrobiales bacterium]